MDAMPIHRLVGEAGEVATSMDRLVWLSAHSNWKVRAAVAARPGLPLEIATRLKDDRSSVVVGEIARQPGITKKMRQEFIHRPDGSLRLAVAENPTCEASILEELVQEKTDYLCATVFKHPHLSRKLMEMVIFHSDLTRREIADPERIEDEARKAEVYWWRVAAGALAENPRLPSDLIRPLIAAFSPAFVVQALATREDQPPDLIVDVVQITRTTGLPITNADQRERVPNRILQALRHNPSRRGWRTADPNTELVKEVTQMPYRVTVGRCEVLGKREQDVTIKLDPACDQAQGVLGFFFPGQYDRWFFQQWGAGMEPKSGWLDLPANFDGLAHFVREGNSFGVHSYISFGDGKAHAWQTMMDEAKSLGNVRVPNLEIVETAVKSGEELDCLLAFYTNFNVIGLYGKDRQIFGWKRLRNLQESQDPCRLEDTAVSDRGEPFRVSYVFGVLRNLSAKGLKL